jgi:hypothetical protein
VDQPTSRLSIDSISAAPSQPSLRLQSALSNWENEGGASAIWFTANCVAQTEVAQSMSTELEHLHIRVIAMESLLITLLAQQTVEARRMGLEMAMFISPRPGFTRHLRTLGAAAQMVHIVERARHFQNRNEGEALF